MPTPRSSVRSILGVFLPAAILLASSANLRAAEGNVKPEASPPAADAATKPDAPPAASTTPPGHSMHGDAFNEGPRQKAYLMGGTSNVHMPVTTRVPEAQQFFDQGLGQLHGFWYFEAERSFRQVAALDPDCAMAYWGMALANANNDKRAKSFSEKAQQKKAHASPREIAWIDALAATYVGSDTTERRQKYVRDLEALVQDDPNDVEAKALLALQIWKNGSWMTEKKKQLPISSHQAVDSLLDQVFAANPMHPAHHYRIHLWDEEKAARALVAASLCGQSAPAIAHMWHMPGHTYSKLHRYADAAWQQEASARVDHAHMMRDRVLPDQIHNYAHNNEWLIRNLSYLGRVNDAIDLAINMIDLPRHPKYNALGLAKGSGHFGHTRLADVLLQYERWKDVTAYVDTAYFRPVKDEPADKLKRMRILGLAWFGQENVDEGRKQIAAAEEMLKERRAARYAAADEAESKARADKKSDADVAKAMADALAERGGLIKNIEQVLAELRGWKRWQRTTRPRPRNSSKPLRTIVIFAGTIWRDTSRWPAIMRRRNRWHAKRSRRVPVRSIRWRCWSTCSRGPERSRKRRANSPNFASWRPSRISTIPCSSDWRRWPPSSTCRPIGESRASRRSMLDSVPTWPAWVRFAGSPLRPRAGAWRAPTASRCRSIGFAASRW